MSIYNPSSPPCLIGVLMTKIMTFSAQGSEILVTAKPLSHPASLMVQISCFLTLATLALWVEGKIRLLVFGILAIFALALGGCIPQPSAALEWCKSFEWSLFH